MAGDWKASLDSWLFGSAFILHFANRKVARKLNACSLEDFSNDDRLRLPEQLIFNALDVSIQRLERIEDKAKATLLGVFLGTSVLSVGVGLLGRQGVLGDEGDWLRCIAAVLLLLGMLYLLSSGYLALRAYEIGQVYRPGLTDHAPLSPEGRQKQMLLFCMEQNNRIVTLRANRLVACFYFLRNGLVAVLLFGTVALCASI